MDLALPVLAVLAAAALVAAAVMGSKLKAALAALAEAERRLTTVVSPPPPPRVIESRREHYGLLWFPTLTLKDDERAVVAASAGLPHCARCVKPLALNPGPPEEWACGSCSERRPPTAADLQVTDAVTAATLREFLDRHPGWRPAPGVERKAPPGAP